MMAGGIHCHQRRQILQDEFEFLLFPPRRRSISNEFAYQRLLMIATFIRDGFIQFQNEVLAKLVNAVQQLSSRYLYCFFNHFNSKSIDIKFGGPKIDFRPFGFFYTFWYEIFVEFKRIYFKFVAQGLFNTT